MGTFKERVNISGGGYHRGGITRGRWVCSGNGYPRRGEYPRGMSMSTGWVSWGWVVTLPLDTRPGGEYPPPIDRQTHVKTLPSRN